MTRNRVAIVDYGVGNLFSVEQACKHVGLLPQLTSDPASIVSADAVILPGVGAFSFAMQRLQSLGLTSAILNAVDHGTPLLGICLGFQLLFEESEEMGQNRGLGLFSGAVRPLAKAVSSSGSHHVVRIPNIAWLPIYRLTHPSRQLPWEEGMLAGLPNGANMYFVHSYFVQPGNTEYAVAETAYNGFEYCCATERENVFGCQFHPEKSATDGLQIYRNLATKLQK